MSLARQILGEVAGRGDRPVLVAPGLRLGGHVFAQVVRNMALHLVRRGIGRGALVAVRSDDLVVSLASILATGLLGCRWTMAGIDSRGADLLLDTAPDGQSLPGALLLDESWAVQPMAEAEGMFPGPGLDTAPWLVFPAASGLGGTVELSQKALLLRFRAEAGSYDRMGKRIAGLLGPDSPDQLLLCLSGLYHGAVLVESADPQVWQSEGVSLVAGPPEGLALCLGAGRLAPPIAEAQLWAATLPRADIDRLAQSFQRVALVGRVAAGSEPPGEGPEPGPSLALLDQLFRQIDGVVDATAFMAPRQGQADRLTVFLVLAPGADVPKVTSEARIAALRLGGKAAVPKRFLLADTLPRHADGSPDHAGCREMIALARRKRRVQPAGL